MAVLILLFVAGWVAAAVLGTQAYFLGEQTKPIHARNWRSKSFEDLSESLTNQEIDFNHRVPAFQVADAYASNLLPNA